MYQDLPQQEHHQMLLEIIDDSGTEEWYCPTCGRRFLMQKTPEYKMVTLVDGDLYAIHTGGAGGLQINSSQGNPIEGGSPDDPRLQTWSEWFDRVQFGSRWNKDSG